MASKKKILFINIDERWAFLNSFKRGVASRFIIKLLEYFFRDIEESRRWKVVSDVAAGKLSIESMLERKQQQQGPDKPSDKSSVQVGQVDEGAIDDSRETGADHGGQAEVKVVDGLSALDQLRKRAGRFKK